MNGTKTVIIDDSDFFCTIMKKLCTDMGLEVEDTFSRGDIFLERLRAGLFKNTQLLLLDINLPGKSGKELIEEILQEAPDLIIIMISSLSSMDIVKECILYGAANYINKDTAQESMRSIIETTLEMNA